MNENINIKFPLTQSPICYILISYTIFFHYKQKILHTSQTHKTLVRFRFAKIQISAIRSNSIASRSFSVDMYMHSENIILKKNPECFG